MHVLSGKILRALYTDVCALAADLLPPCQVVDLEQSGSETALLGTVEGAQLVSGDGRQALLLLSQGELLALFFS